MDSASVVVVNLSVNVVPSRGGQSQFSVFVGHAASKMAVWGTDRPVLSERQVKVFIFRSYFFFLQWFVLVAVKKFIQMQKDIAIRYRNVRKCDLIPCCSLSSSYFQFSVSSCPLQFDKNHWKGFE